jgi:hypothetical protein
MEFLNWVPIVAILLISTAPLYAQRQQQNVAKLKADDAGQLHCNCDQGTHHMRHLATITTTLPVCGKRYV